MKRLSVAAGAVALVGALAMPAAGQWQQQPPPGYAPVPGYAPAPVYAPPPTIVYPGPVVPPTPVVPGPTYTPPGETLLDFNKRFLQPYKDEARELDRWNQADEALGAERARAGNCFLRRGHVDNCGG